VRDRIDYQVKMQVRKMEQELRRREDEIMQKLTDMRGKDKDHNDER